MRTTNGSGRFESGGGRGRGRWGGRGRGRGRSGGDGNDSMHKKGSNKAKTWRPNDDALESRFGYQNFTEGEPRLGWLLNMVSSSMVDPSNELVTFSCVDLYFMCQDGSTFKVQVKFAPYFYVGTKENTELEVDAYLRRRYEGQIANIEVVSKEDLGLKNHLAGLQRRYLKVSFNTVQELMSVKSELLPLAEKNRGKLESGDAQQSLPSNTGTKFAGKLQDYFENIVDLREYDVPYHIRFAIDNDIRCGLWYKAVVEGFQAKLERRTDLLQRAEVRVCAFDIETTKLPLKFPDALYDTVMMISYMVDGQGYLIVNRECVGADIEDLEYAPKPEFESHFKVTNTKTEKELLVNWFSHMQEVKPNIFVTYNGDFFDWPFIQQRALHHGMKMRDEIGFQHNEQVGECLSKFSCHLDCFAWVKRDSYLPQGSQGLKAVTKAKLGFDPLEVNPEDMLQFALDQPQTMASYSVSDAVSTYYLYMTYVHPFIFSLATIIPMPPDEVLRKGSGTLCEVLLMVQAFKGNIVCPNKYKSEQEKVYKGRMLESETYIGGHVECLESGVFRSDLPTRFHLTSKAYQKLIDNLDRDLTYSIREGKMELDSVLNYEDVKNDIKHKLEILRDSPNRDEMPLIYHLDVAAMYPNIILTNRLQPPSIVTDEVCAACDFNSPGKTCLRDMEWVWRGETYMASRSEFMHLKNQIESEQFSTMGYFGDLPIDQQQSKLKDRLKKYCQKVYKRVLDKPITDVRSASVCMRENPFYVDTVKSFRDRRYEYKGLNKVWKGKLGDARASGNPIKIQEASDMVVLYDSLQLAHKCILNSFYGYVMRKGARWYSMEMAGVVTYTGAKIIQNARVLVEQIGKPLELDTDGIWCALPGSFPENFTFKNKGGKKLTISYPCVMLNVDVALNNTNDQYQTLVDPLTRNYSTSSECSIEFEVDGPYKAMILPASKEEGVLLKKRYAVFNDDGTLAELKGFEIKRRGELKLIKVFQAEVFDNFLQGQTLEECYGAVAAVANRWLDLLENQGVDVTDSELLGYISESSTMSKSLEDYGDRKSCASTTARRLADFLGAEMVKDKGLSCRYIVARDPQGAPVSERAIPCAIFETDREIMQAYIRKWCKSTTDVAIRNIIDWNYYRQRLSSAIQKIITIPAAMQKVVNPVPRVVHPEWLWKKVQEKNDKLRQKSLKDMFGPKEAFLPLDDDLEDIQRSQGGKLKVPKPVIHLYSNREEQTALEDNQSAPVIREKTPDKDTHYGDWLELKKKKWKATREKRKRHTSLRGSVEIWTKTFYIGSLRQTSSAKMSWALNELKEVALHSNPDTTSEVILSQRITYSWGLKRDDSGGVISNSLGNKQGPQMRASVGSLFKTQKAQFTNTYWQILQLSHSQKPGEVIMWVLAENDMFKIPLQIPRIFYLNTQAPNREEYPGACVTRILPHGHPVFNLIEVVVDEEQFKLASKKLASHLADPHVKGVYETKVSLVHHCMLQLGCVCTVDKRARDKTKRDGWSLNDLHMKTTSECSYLMDNMPYIFLYHSWMENRGVFAIYMPQASKIFVVVVNPFNNREVTIAQLERQFQDVLRTQGQSDVATSELICKVEFVSTKADAGRLLQRTLNEYRDQHRGPTLAVLECPLLEAITGLVPAFSELPCIQVPCNARDSAYQALGWQRLACRVAMERCGASGPWLHERITLCRYAHVPLGNLNSDWLLFTADTFFARALRDHQQVLWVSNNGLPDLGGVLEAEAEYMDDVEHLAWIYPGAYRSICIELKVHHLAVNAVLKSSYLNELNGGLLLGLNSENPQDIAVPGQMSLDESVSCAPAFRVLKQLVQGWLSDAVSSGNTFADALLQHLYRWLCSPKSKLHDPALQRIVHKAIQKIFALLLAELKKLGANVVFADFSHIIVETGKHQLTAAQGYCDYLMKILKSRELFEWIELVPNRYWHSLLFMDQYNYGGIQAKNVEPATSQLSQDPTQNGVNEIISSWNIAEYLPTEMQDYFVVILSEYIYKPWKYLHDQASLGTYVGAQEGIGSQLGNASYVNRMEAQAISYLKDQIASYFTDKLLRVVQDVQKHVNLRTLREGDEGPRHFRKLAGSQSIMTDPVLEFIKQVCHVLALDRLVQYDILVMRRNLLKLVHVQEFSAEAEFKDPCHSFTLPNVICSYCNDCRDLDLCRDPALLEHDWRCIVPACGQPCDRVWIENSLLQIVRQQEELYHLQDLVCVRCHMVKATHLVDQCYCAGAFKTKMSLVDFNKNLQIFLNIAKFHGFELLEEIVTWLLTSMMVTEVSKRSL